MRVEERNPNLFWLRGLGQGIFLALVGKRFMDETLKFELEIDQHGLSSRGCAGIIVV